MLPSDPSIENKFVRKLADIAAEKSGHVSSLSTDGGHPTELVTFPCEILILFTKLAYSKSHLLNNSLFNNFFRKFSPSPDFSLSCIF